MSGRMNEMFGGSSRPQTAATSHKCKIGHKLGKTNGKPEEYGGYPMCDVCRTTRLDQQRSFYHCKPCGYDLCKDCADGKNKS